MNLIKTYIDKSSIQGIGLFAGEFILKGKKIWELNGFDLMLRERNYEYWIANMTEEQLKYIKRYIYFNDGDWIYCSDDAKFKNHSKDPNTIVNKYDQYALKDIRIGEEITCDYSELDKSFTEEEFKED